MAGQRVLILLGSPRRRGNSSLLAEHLAKGAEDAGAQVDMFFIQEMGINPCTGCDRCQEQDAKGCVIDDAMQTVYEMAKSARSIVFASPVYWFSVTAQLKAVIDRLYAIGGGDRSFLQGKALGVLLVYADSDPFTSGAVNALRMFQDISAYLGADLTGAVYGSAWKAGEIGQNKAVLRQAYELGKKLGSSRQEED